MLTLVLTLAAALAGTDPASHAGRTLRTEADIPAPVAEVWNAFTTKDGIESWMVPLCDIDFRPGGTLRTTYNKAEGLEGPGTITHAIVSYEPERVLVWKTKAPANANPGIRAVCESGWTILRFEPTSAASTHITVSMMGIGDDADSSQGYAFFEKGNRWSMDQLRKHFEKDSAAINDAAWELASRLAGGTWSAQVPVPEGAPATTVRNVITLGPGGTSLLGDGRFVTAASSLFHSSSQIYRLGAHGPLLFHEVNHTGAHADGSLRRDADTLVWDWNARNPDGTTQPYTIRQTFTGPDTYRMTMADDTGKQLMETQFTREPTAPAASSESAAGWPGLPTSVDPATFAWAGPAPTITKTTTVNASAADVFKVISTGEGWKSFLGVADAAIDLRPGGKLEISFGAEAPPGSRGSEGCQVLSFVPDRTLSFTWNSPPKFAAERPKHTWVVISLADAGPGKTDVRLDHLGFGQGGNWSDIHTYFDRAWGNVLAALKQHYEGEAKKK